MPQPARPPREIGNHRRPSPIVCCLCFPLLNRLAGDWTLVKTGGTTVAKRQKKTGFIERLRQSFHRFWNE
jgi:hypothetical protein